MKYAAQDILKITCYHWFSIPEKRKKIEKSNALAFESTLEREKLEKSV